MLDMGFAPQIRKIVTQLPRSDRRQTLMFSATFAQPMQRVAAEYLRGAAHTAHVTVGRVGSSMSTIEQHLVLAEEGTRRGKLERLRPLVVPGERTIIFAAKKHVAKWVRAQLEQDGMRAVEIHGDRSQGQREAALRQFREGEADILVATDVAARGLDVPDVGHVIQFDLPLTEADFDAYVHRIGRTGRAGKSGRATSLFVPGDEPKVGNGALWQPLALILHENGQEFPRWFEECRPRSAQDPRATAGAKGMQTVAGRSKGASPKRSLLNPQESSSASDAPAQFREGVVKGRPSRAKSPPVEHQSNRRDRRAAAAVAAGRGPNAGPLIQSSE